MRTTTTFLIVALLLLMCTAAHSWLPPESSWRVWLGASALLLGMLFLVCTLCAAFPTQVSAFWRKAWPDVYYSPLFGPIGEFTVRRPSPRRTPPANASSRSATRRVRFGLLAMFAGVTVLCLGLGLYSGRSPCLVVARVEVVRPSSPVLPVFAPNSDHQELTATLHDENFLLATIRDPETGQLPLIRSHVDPIAWLKRRLSLWAPAGAHTIEIRLRAERRYSRDAVELLDRIVDAYVADYHRRDQAAYWRQITHVQHQLNNSPDLIHKLVDQANSFRTLFGENDPDLAVRLAEIHWLRRDERRLARELEYLRNAPVPSPPLKLVESANVVW